MKRSVRCIREGSTSFSPSLYFESGPANCFWWTAIACLASSGRSTATKSRIGSPALGPFAPPLNLHSPPPRHFGRRLRPLELDHVAAADELKRPHTRFVVADHGDRHRADR